LIEEERVLDITNNLEERLAKTNEVLSLIEEHDGSPIHSTILINQHAIMRAQHFNVAMMLDLGINIDKYSDSVKALAAVIPGIAKIKP
jgi:hypothetical protein